MSHDPIGRAQDVILAEDGSPFTSKAKAAKKADELRLDAKVYAIIKQDGGWAIVRRESATFQAAAALENEAEGANAADRAGEKPKAERHFTVRFHARQNSSEPLNVEGCVNQEILVMQREVDVILPERFVRHFALCRYPDERQLPGQPRKVVGWIQTYPFTVIGETTKEAFLKQRREGTEKTRKKFTEDESGGFDTAAKPVEDALAGMGIR